MASLKLLVAALLVAYAAAQGIDGPPPNCVDKNENCKHWTKYCVTNNWVQRACYKSCNNCEPIDRNEADEEENELSEEDQNGQNLKIANVEPPKRVCKDKDEQCKEWVSAKATLCNSNDYIARNCRDTCGYCGDLPRQYNIRFLPPDLQPVAFLIGRWRSEFGGKAIFPTIPKFTYGEQLDFSIAGPPMFGARSLNYSAVAWGINNKEELHSEYGFISVRNHTHDVALTTVMNNGFTTVEEGQVNGNEFRVRLQDIGRISFSRDLPVHDLVRTWRLLDENTLEAVLEMETLTHPLQEHTRIEFKKIYP